MYDFHTCFPVTLRDISDLAQTPEIRIAEINWLEIDPSIVTSLPIIPPPCTIIGALSFFLIEKQLIPSCLRANNNGRIGRFLILSSPVITTYPSSSNDEIVVTKRIVVPEFSTLTTLSGILRGTFP